MAEIDPSGSVSRRRRFPSWLFVGCGCLVLLLAASRITIIQVPKGAIRMAKITRAQAQVKVIGQAVRIHYIVRGRLPYDLDDLRSPHKDLDEPLLDFVDDPWGHPFEYVPGANRGFTVRCLGADGLPGGEGEDADIVLVDPGTPK
jgi:general secretion pathway protein G